MTTTACCLCLVCASIFVFLFNLRTLVHLKKKFVVDPPLNELTSRVICSKFKLVEFNFVDEKS